MNSEYNKEHIFDSQLKEMLDKIDIICRQEQIPYFFTCAIKNDEQDTKYHSEMLSTLKSDRILKNDIIAEMLEIIKRVSHNVKRKCFYFIKKCRKYKVNDE